MEVKWCYCKGKPWSFFPDTTLLLYEFDGENYSFRAIKIDPISQILSDTVYSESGSYSFVANAIAWKNKDPWTIGYLDEKDLIVKDGGNEYRFLSRYP